MDGTGAGGGGDFEAYPDDIEYCICRSTDCSRFMIGCDNCEEWYHGDCIGVSEKDARIIRKFFCHICREKNPGLKIKYEKIKEEKHRVKERPPKEKEKDREKPVKDKDREREKLAKEKERERERAKEKEREREKLAKEKEKQAKEKEKEKEKPSARYEYDSDYEESKKEKHRKKEKEKMKERRKSSQNNKKKSSRRCDECTACHRDEDCGRCDYCKDMRKFGGPNKIRQKCRLRQCLNFGLTKFQVLQQKQQQVAHHTEESDNVNIMDEGDDEHSHAQENNKHPSSVSKRRKSGDSDYKHPSSKKARSEKSKKQDRKRTSTPKEKRTSTPRRKAYKGSDEDEPRIDVEENEPRQCIGPGCIELAREGSKYCSDECGMKLATNRIFEVLPQRIQQWNSSACLAEENNRGALERVRRDQLVARQKLVALDLKHSELDSLIERAKHATIDPDYENTEEDEAELNVYCVTCGHEVNQRTALRHMEKCFTKYEGQTSFGSIYKTRIEGNSMFCDYYNSQQQTYCKRLKVLCPEHSKEPKVSENEVCGCPKVTEVFEETGEYCRVPKRKCNKHFCWEKLRRAEIDMERVRQWMHLDDLFEQERNIRFAMANRAGVLGLMLHQTIDHDPMNPIRIKAQ